MTSNIIRITTEDDDSRFDGQLNADLVLKPGAQIALKSLYIEKENDLINIRTDQNKITYSYNNNKVVATLANNVYDNNTFQVLLDDIQSKLNNNINYDPTTYTSTSALQLGMDFQAALNDDL